MGAVPKEVGALMAELLPTPALAQESCLEIADEEYPCEFWIAAALSSGCVDASWAPLRRIILSGDLGLTRESVELPRDPDPEYSWAKAGTLDCDARMATPSNANNLFLLCLVLLDPACIIKASPKRLIR